MKTTLFGLIALLLLAAPSFAQREKSVENDPKIMEIVTKFMKAIDNPDMDEAAKACVPYLHRTLLTGEGDDRDIDTNCKSYAFKLAWTRVAKDRKYPDDWKVHKQTQDKDKKLGAREDVENCKIYYYYIKGKPEYRSREGWLGISVNSEGVIKIYNVGGL